MHPTLANELSALELPTAPPQVEQGLRLLEEPQCRSPARRYVG